VGRPPEENAGLAAGEGPGPGSRVAGYLVEERVGRGGMAVVFRARDERLGRLVALKVLAPVLAEDAEFRERFIRESRAAAAVDDPHIIPVFEAGEADGVLFIAMRYVAGGDVRSLLRRSGPLPVWRAATILSPVASALDAAHSAGLVHRDVKPANMLVDTRPGRPPRRQRVACGSWAPGDFVVPRQHDRLFSCGRLDAGQALCAGRAGGVEQGACDALPLPGFEFADRGVEIGQQLADMALDIAFDAVGSDLVPVGAFDDF
jgi:serine/threonine protein kinase